MLKVPKVLQVQRSQNLMFATPSDFFWLLHSIGDHPVVCHSWWQVLNTNKPQMMSHSQVQFLMTNLAQYLDGKDIQLPHQSFSWTVEMLQMNLVTILDLE